MTRASKIVSNFAERLKSVLFPPPRVTKIYITQRPMTPEEIKHFNAAFDHMDKAFDEMNKALL